MGRVKRGSGKRATPQVATSSLDDTEIEHLKLQSFQLHGAALSDVHRGLCPWTPAGGGVTENAGLENEGPENTG